MITGEYDSIAKCIRRHGTKGQRKALRSMMLTGGWDQTHGHKIEIGKFETEIAELRTENFLLRREIRNHKDKEK